MNKMSMTIPPLHPEQVANLQKRANALGNSISVDLIVSKIVNDRSLRFLHVRDYGLHEEGEQFAVRPNGGMTIAYTSGHIKSRQGSVIEFATALCNPLDTFCKREGRNRAAIAFCQGRTVSIARPDHDSTLSQSRFMLETFDPIRAFRDLLEVSDEV